MAPHPLAAKIRTVGRRLVEVAALRDDVDDQSAERGAGELGHPVVQRLHRRDLPAEQEAERDRRVDVAARHVADRVRHRQQHEAERERDAEEAHHVGGDDRGPGADDEEHGRPDELGGRDARRRRLRERAGLKGPLSTWTLLTVCDARAFRRTGWIPRGAVFPTDGRAGDHSSQPDDALRRSRALAGGPRCRGSSRGMQAKEPLTTSQREHEALLRRLAVNDEATVATVLGVGFAGADPVRA